MNGVARVSNQQPTPMMKTILLSLACYTLLIPGICAQPSGGDPFFRPPPSDDDRLSDDVLFNRLIVAVHDNDLNAVSRLVYTQIGLADRHWVRHREIQAILERKTQQGQTLVEAAIRMEFWAIAAYLATYYLPAHVRLDLPGYPRWFRLQFAESEVEEQ